MLLKVVLAIVEMFAMFGVGALAMRLKIIDKNDLAMLNRLIVDLLFPMLAFSSITRNFDASQVRELWQMPLLGFGIMAFGALLGYGLRYGMTNRGAGRIETFHHFCAINNYVFLPLIILDNLWGEQYLPLLFIMNIGSTIGFWTVGVGLLAGGNIKGTLKNIFTVNLAAVAVALIFSFGSIPIPTVLGSTFAKLGGASVPLMLMVIGAAIYVSAHRVLENKRDILYLCLVRLVILPLIVVGILKLLTLPPDVYRVVSVVALMPVSASSVVIAHRYGGNADFAGQAVLVTTLASIVSVPLMLHLL